MIEHISSVLCNRAIIDEHTNTVSIQNVIEQIIFEEEPEPNSGLRIDCDLISLWGRLNLKKSVTGYSKIEYKSPSDEILLSHEFDIDLKEFERRRNVLKFQGLPIKGIGKYYFCIYWRRYKKDDWILSAKIPLVLKVKSN